MEPEQPSQPDPKLQTVYNPLRVMREGEEVLCEIKRHPIGLVGVYGVTGALIAIAIAAAVIAPSHVPNVTTQYREAVAFGALIISVMALLFAYIARIVYKGNRWILTDDSLTQVTQQGLFRTHSSQLSLANLEDVTADQNGIVQALFGYGVLRCETAGERSKFVFPYCPKPNEYARRILEARENFIMNEPEHAHRANDKLMTPGMMQGFGAQQAAAAQPMQPPQTAPEPPVSDQQQASPSLYAPDQAAPEAPKYTQQPENAEPQQYPQSPQSPQPPQEPPAA